MRVAQPVHHGGTRQPALYLRGLRLFAGGPAISTIIAAILSILLPRYVMGIPLFVLNNPPPPARSDTHAHTWLPHALSGGSRRIEKRGIR
jgi:hypothetical protein